MVKPTRLPSLLALGLLTGSAAAQSCPAYRPQPPEPAATSPGPQPAPATASPATAAPTAVDGVPTATAPGPCAAPTGARAASARGAATAARQALAIDFTSWQHWWEFNQHTFLRLRASSTPRVANTGSEDFYMGEGRAERDRAGLRPAREDLTKHVVPALRDALEQPDQAQITPAALVALAKVQLEDLGEEIDRTIRARLASENRSIREAATLALGIAGRNTAVPDLVALIEDTPRGRQLTALSQVDFRLRAFACYALGLVAHRSESLDDKRHVLTALAQVLDTPSERLEVQVAAVQGIGLLRPHPTRRSYKDWTLVSDCVSTLRSFYAADERAGTDIARAHVATAIAKLTGRGNPLSAAVKRELEQHLHPRAAENGLLRQSAALALGSMATPGETRYSDSLLRYYRSGRDQQTRFFSLIALGQIGGDQNRTALLIELERANRAIEAPWCALALGVLAHHTTEKDPTIGRRLHQLFRSTKNDGTRGAAAIALGLAGHTEAADDILQTLQRYGKRDELASHLCVALALLPASSSTDSINAVADASENRPQRLLGSCIALAQLGDHRIADKLADNLVQDRVNLPTLAATATALGLIGDRRTIQRLVQLENDDSLTRWGRGYAISALGAISDPALVPWHAALTNNMNYRAGVATLRDGSAGVLDAF